MVDYSKLSDAEIGQKVFFWVNDKLCPEGGLAHISDGGFFYFTSNGVKKSFDPCNNPADAWPIINDNQIALIPSHMSFGWIASSYLTLSGNASYVDERLDNCIKHEDWNGLRAAMIVFLLMQDVKNG